MNAALFEKAAKIRLLICDLDGVLTDGYIYLTNESLEIRAFHIHDGFGLKLLMNAGIEVSVITTAKNSIVQKRMEFLGINHLYMGQANKNAAFQDVVSKLNLELENVAYIGDDLPDLPLIKQVGLGVAVGDAVSEVKTHADWVTVRPGGHGAVRDLCDLILHAQGKMTEAIRAYE